jgi:hypothetical protein
MKKVKKGRYRGHSVYSHMKIKPVEVVLRRGRGNVVELWRG